jgi:hypothetical protein
MEVTMKEIDLRPYRPVNSSSFSGRPQGEAVRKAINLDELDSKQEEVNIRIPADTTSFNPSFFLGLLYDSISRLGMDKFRSKYTLQIETSNERLRSAISSNIEDGFRNAINSLSKKSGLSFFNVKR